MAVIAKTLPNIAAPSEIPRDFTLWRLSVDKYHEMARAGVLSENDPVELLEGWLVYQVPKNPLHSLALLAVDEAFRSILHSDWHIRLQDPVTLLDSEPEPDLAVVRGNFRDYPDRHPGIYDIAVVEIADSSLHQDRGSKKRIYARAGLPIYWIVNLNERQIEVYTDPTGATEQPDYGVRTDYGLEDEVPVIIDGCEIGRLQIADLLP